MTIIEFPPVSSADRSGLIAIGGDFEVESLVLAYSSGIFPWPSPDYPLAWFAPPRRAIIEFENYHESKSFLRWLKNTEFTVTCNTAFASTMRCCAGGHVKPGETAEESTWITAEMISAYTELHNAGVAHSCEVWEGDNLVGGVYGISIGAMFAAESMFHRRDNASKLALHSLVAHLKVCGVSWIDVQVINAFTKSLGATEIKRDKFMQMLNEAINKPALKFPNHLES